MIAILHDAIECVEKYRFAMDAHGQQLFQEARQWLLADEAAWPYSFEGICGILDLDPTAVRQSLGVAQGKPTRPSHDIKSMPRGPGTSESLALGVDGD